MFILFLRQMSLKLFSRISAKVFQMLNTVYLMQMWKYIHIFMCAFAPHQKGLNKACAHDFCLASRSLCSSIFLFSFIVCQYDFP